MLAFLHELGATCGRSGGPLIPRVPKNATPSTIGAPTIEKETRAEEELDLPWHVVVHNDPVNLMSYVTMVFQRVFGYPRDKAERHMLEVHHKGRSILWSGMRERAELYVQQLHGYLLLATIEKVSSHGDSPAQNQIEISELDPFLAELLRQIPASADTEGAPAAEQRIFSSPINGKERNCALSGKCMSNLNCAVYFRPRPRPLAPIWSN
jgi:ATP-dependent Clp protease adaptor protein ClpS